MSSPLTKNSTIDTDADSLTDWDEVNTELLVWNDDGSFELPAFSVSAYMVNCARYNTPTYDFLNNASPVKYLPILSDPTEEDSDGDGIYDQKTVLYDSKMVFQSNQYKVLNDPEPLLETFLPDFGTEEYKEKIEAENSVPVQDVPILYYGTFGFYRMYINSLTESAENKILAMMNDVNNCQCTDLITNDNWIKFCEYFNECVQEYGDVTQDIHYFRLKLNRAPSTLNEMLNILGKDKDAWTLCTIWETRFHMIGENGEYNLKFVSSNSSNNMYEAVYDKEGILLTVDNSPENMGTYNYAGTKTSNSLHHHLDVDTYYSWGNIAGVPYNEGEELTKFVSEKSRKLINDDATAYHQLIEADIQNGG